MSSLHEYKSAFSQREMYNDYKKNRRLNSKVTRNDFFRIVTKFNKGIVKLLLYKNLHFEFPYGLGTLWINKIKKHGTILDDQGNIIYRDLVKDKKRTFDLWKEDPVAKKERKFIYNLNEHTDGYVYKYVWSKRGVNIRNASFYRFRPSRANKLLLRDVLTNDDLQVDFFEYKKYK